jgi:hypothetical protein
MAKNGYDQTYEDDRKQNEEDLDLPRRAGEAIVKGAKKVVNFATPEFVKTAVDRISKSELDTDKVKKDTGKTTNPMGDKYAKGGSVSSASKRADGIATKGKTRGKMC